MSIERTSPTLAPRCTSVDDLRPWNCADKVVIYADEALRIARFVREYPCIETGGELFGYWLDSGAPVVSYILGPGLGSIHQYTSFHQDPDWLNDVGTELYDRHALQHIGAWHSHHRLGLNQPSKADVRTVVRGIEGRSKFLLMIATLDAAPNSPVVQSYYLVGRNGNYKPLRLKPLTGSSPFRTGPDHAGEESVRDPAAIVPWCSGELAQRLHRQSLERPSAANGRARRPKSDAAEPLLKTPSVHSGTPSPASKRSLGEATVPEEERSLSSCRGTASEANEQGGVGPERETHRGAGGFPARLAPYKDVRRGTDLICVLAALLVASRIGRTSARRAGLSEAQRGISVLRSAWSALWRRVRRDAKRRHRLPDSE